MIFRKLFSWALGLLPTIDIGDGTVASATSALNWAYFADYYLPIDTFVTCVGIYLTTWLICIVLSAVLKLL